MNFNTIRTSKQTKVIAVYMAIQLVVSMVQPLQLWASTSGPSQPEFNSFTPIGTSDMVDLASGDFNYNIPVMDVGGYPLNLAYNSGITMDQESSWVGLGWNLNVGHIDRSVRGIPDDFDGDNILYENDFKTNTTVGAAFNVSGGIFGNEGLKGNVGLTATYNNYEGISFQLQQGLGIALSENLQVGFDISSSATEGATISPSLSLSSKEDKNNSKAILSKSTLGLSHNSREGIKSFMLQSSLSDSHPDGHQSVNLGSIGLNFNDPTHTPQKRAGLNNGNFTFSAAAGLTFIGLDGFARIDGFGSYQEIREEEKKKFIPAFGYENTENAEGINSVLDFNREKDKTFNKHTTAIPLTNYTYDVYSINGQGINASFRPYKGQVGYVGDTEVLDVGNGFSLGARFGGGNLGFVGGDVEVSTSSSRTGLWKNKNNALGKFTPVNNLEQLDYEPTYFKIIGENNIDKEEESLFQNELFGATPMRFPIEGKKFNRKISASFETPIKSSLGVKDYLENPISSSKLKRDKRVLRREAVLKVSNAEAEYDPFVDFRGESFAKPYHTVGYKIFKSDGSRYVFGASAYNITKTESTFDVSGKSQFGNCQTGLISNIKKLAGHNSTASDQYINQITTPGYAHSYMLRSVLSADYEDIDENGPSLNDLGTYTLFNYKKYNTGSTPFKWRLPYDFSTAYYNEGLKSDEDDEKGNVLYGEKELTYINTIETKTHVAYFELENREDARGAKNMWESDKNISTPAYSKRISKIYLFSRPEFELFRANIEDDDVFNNPNFEVLSKKAIKIAHFEYDYTLCNGVPNNLNNGGKLTLKKLYFTYNGSNMGKYMPYTFNYDSLNPDYNAKSFDVWGNFKPLSENLVETDEFGNVNILKNNNSYCSVNDPLIAPEFPYTDQNNRELQDQFAASWTLSSIDLPSGGHMDLKYESDDYRYVQDKNAMQMFKVAGSGDEPISGDLSSANTLYKERDGHKYLYVKINDEPSDAARLAEIKSSFLNEYLNNDIEAPIQFRFLLNMVNKSSSQYDYVSGYLKLDGDNFEAFADANGTYISLPLQFLDNEGGLIKSSHKVNPIAKAGWYFGRSNLNRQVYSIGGEGKSDDFKSIVNNLIGALPAVFELFTGPNTRLQQKKSSQKFIPEKSWIRLQNPNKRKIGGGIRVKEIKILDNWDIMTNNQGDASYSQYYGQQYNYNDENGNSSGVAAFEPYTSRENPFIQPFYDAPGDSNSEKLIAPMELNYTEKPFGESFFPMAKVTYARVLVKNLERKIESANDVVSAKVGKHATGSIVHEFYTSKDFPTKVEFTELGKKYDKSNVLGSLLSLGIKEKNHLTLSQGFTIETNDMDGKPKAQFVYPEGKDAPISSVNYQYSLDPNGDIENHLPVINPKGEVSTKHSLGLSYDVINDFRESKSNFSMVGVNLNVTVFLLAIFPGIVAVPLPKYSSHENILRTAALTKVIHKSGILKKKIVTDLGSNLETENVAWDSETGNEILTKTNNEYDDNYYNLMFPSHWAYDNMGLASANLGIKGSLIAPSEGGYFNVSGASNLRTIFTEGDELMTRSINGPKKYWVHAFNFLADGVRLIDKNGNILDPCGDDGIDYNFKIIRSGYRNLPGSTMASITTILNPIDINGDAILDNFDESSFEFLNVSDKDPKILNASAIEYSDFWRPQKESGLPSFPNDDKTNEAGEIENGYHYKVNPYLYNIKGNWKAYRSYAYLTPRQSRADVSTRNEGFYSSFKPYYTNSNGKWSKAELAALPDKAKWTFASEITQFSPYGPELENRDALSRFSSAQYGYNYTLPIAVASNSQYKEMGFDGMEDYAFSDSNANNHFNFQASVQAFSNLTRTSEQSHTGKHSLKLNGNSQVSFKTSLVSQEVSSEAISEYCPDPPPSTNPRFVSGGVYCRDYECTYVGNENLCYFKYKITLSGLDPSHSYFVEVNAVIGDGTYNNRTHSVTVLEDGTGIVLIQFTETSKNYYGTISGYLYDSTDGGDFIEDFDQSITDGDVEKAPDCITANK